MQSCLPRLALLALLLPAALGPALAAPVPPNEGSVALEPASATVARDAAFTIAVAFDATGIGGAVPGYYEGSFVVGFDPALLRFDAFTVAPDLSLFSDPVAGGSGNRQTITIGFTAKTGSGPIGSFAFTAIGDPGSLATIDLGDADDLFGSFVNVLPTYRSFVPTFTGATVSIVPLPAAGLLLAAALGGLAGLGRRAGSAAR